LTVSAAVLSIASAARTGAVLARLHDRAGRADDAQGLPCATRSDRGSGQDAISDTSAHAATRLRLCPGEHGPRHTRAAGVPRSQEHPAYGALHRVGTASVQGLLALIDRLWKPSIMTAPGDGDKMVPSNLPCVFVLAFPCVGLCGKRGWHLDRG
jgi:hypothetical protein